jgi:hypothetical protein
VSGWPVQPRVCTAPVDLQTDYANRLPTLRTALGQNGIEPIILKDVVPHIKRTVYRAKRRCVLDVSQLESGVAVEAGDAGLGGGHAFVSNPATFSARAEGSTRWAPARRSGDCLTARVATLAGELETGSQLAGGDRQSRSRELPSLPTRTQTFSMTSSTTSRPHLTRRLTIQVIAREQTGYDGSSFGPIIKSKSQMTAS